MGGLMRAGHHHHHHHQGNNGIISNSNSISNSRGRSYVIMLLVVAFGAALLISGIMIIHRIKERRIFNLVIKDRDTQLTSFHLLLQKEKEHTKDAKWKLADMRAKLNAIRAQKRELDNRVSEMQSVISSLRDEQRLIESTLEDKHNEIKVLKEKLTEINAEGPRVVHLSEMIKNKDSEIDDLKRRVESLNTATQHEKSDESDSSSLGTNNGQGSEVHQIGEQSGVENTRAASSFLEKNVVDRSGSDEQEKAVLETKDDNAVLGNGDEHHFEENEGLGTTGSVSLDQTSTVHGREKQIRMNNEGGNELETSITNGQAKQADLNNENNGSSAKTITNGKTFTNRIQKNKRTYESNGGVTRRNGRAFPETENQQTLEHEEGHDSEDPAAETKDFTLQQGQSSNQTVNEETVMQHHETQTEVAENEKQNNAETKQNIPQGNGLLPKPYTSGEGEDLEIHADSKSTSLQVDQRGILNDINRSTKLIDAPIKDMPINMTVPKYVGKEESMEARLKVQNEIEEQNQESKEDMSKVQNQANGIQKLVEKIDDQKDDTISADEGDTDEDSIDPEMEDLPQAESKYKTYKDSAIDDSDSGDEEYRDF